MPYLWGAALEAHREGVPMMRAMLLEFPEDPACETLDRQYLLGGTLLVAPVFTESGFVDYYLPAGRWTNLLTGEVHEGAGWRREQHGFLSLPLMVRPNTILPLGAIDDRPDYDYADGVTFRLYEITDGSNLTCEVFAPQRSDPARLNVRRADKHVTVEFAGDALARWRVQLANVQTISLRGDSRTFTDPSGVVVEPGQGSRTLEFELEPSPS
jgi:alpha-D-xyloside xylohydrolase